jgi:hypothetical protein
MHVDRYLGLVRDAESVLAESLTMIADRHQRDAEIRQTALLLSDWSQRHVAALEPLEERYGVRPTEHARRLRASLFYGTRIGGLGLLLDLHDLSLQVHQVRMLWTALAQVAAELKDKDLQRLCLLAAAETDRQTAWIKTQTKHRAAQAIVVPADPVSEQEASVPARPTAAAIPDPAWSPIAAAC